MGTITECIRKYVEKHGEVTSYEVINYILKEKKFETTENAIRLSLKRVLNEVGGNLKPYGLTAEIRSYVEAHNNEVTSCEVINYILKEKKFKTTENNIRSILSKILNEVGGNLKNYGLTAEIRSYVEAHDNEVTSYEVINYILKEKKFETTENNIRSILNRSLNEVGGKLKPPSYGITAAIRSYVEAHNNEVTSCEVINYILKEKKFETTENTIRSTLYKILNEVGGKLKPYGLTAEIRNYVKSHDNEVTSCEVINYILKEKKFKTTENAIRSALYKILNEVSGKLKPYGL